MAGPQADRHPGASGEVTSGPSGTNGDHRRGTPARWEGGRSARPSASSGPSLSKNPRNPPQLWWCLGVLPVRSTRICVPRHEFSLDIGWCGPGSDGHAAASAAGGGAQGAALARQSPPGLGPSNRVDRRSGAVRGATGAVGLAGREAAVTVRPPRLVLGMVERLRIRGGAQRLRGLARPAPGGRASAVATGRSAAGDGERAHAGLRGARVRPQGSRSGVHRGARCGAGGARDRGACLDGLGPSRPG